MSRLEQTFETLKQQGKQALVPYIMAGDPNLDASLALMHQLVEQGADVLELGIPFSDPMADGPVNQLAAERALAAGATLAGVLDSVAAFREKDSDTPVVLMGYLNPVEWMGYAEFAERAAKAGVDGVLLVDLPPDEADEVKPLFDAQQLDLIFLLAPTSTEARIAKAAEFGSGYLYYVSLKGVTGAATLDVADVAQQLERIRRQLALPICVGFGIKDAATAAEVSEVADGVVVGSALVKQVAAGEPQKAADLLAEMRAAMDK